MPDMLEGLTQAQREAVTHINGPLLVIAGPGSGKTRVITRRAAYLVYCGIKPWNILAITFTNKAAGEMRRRVDALVAQKGIWLSTFHSFCARVLREFAQRLGYGRDFMIFDADDSAKLIREILKEMALSHEDFKPSSLHEAIGAAKERFMTPEDLAEAAQGDFRQQVAARVYGEYERRLAAANAMDFDDLLLNMAVLIRRDEDVLRKLRNRHQFVLVDEFQDTNRSQYVIARLLTEKHRNLCVTGDPDQSIYGWRGADINNILNFEKDYPDAKVVFLDRNYRSTKTILSAANCVVERNTQRKPHTLYTERPEGDKIHLVQCRDSREEGQEIARAIQSLIQEGHAPRDVAVFYRVNALSRQIEEALVESALPYQVVGGVEFYSRREVKDILAYLRFAANPLDETSLMRIINVPPRAIGPKAVEHLRQSAAGKGVPLSNALSDAKTAADLAPRVRASIDAFINIVARVADAGERSAKAAVETAVAGSGYEEMLLSSTDKESRDRLDNLDELMNAAAQYDESNPGDGMRGFLEQTALIGDIDTWHDDENRVTLMTMHAAKGLEFPAVIIAGADEGLLPHANSSSSAIEIEEERRVFFVAMTRAEEHLYIFRADERLVHGSWRFNLPSRFLKEIPPDLVDMKTPGIVSAPFARLPGAEAVPPSHTPAAGREGEPSKLPRVGARVKHKEFGTGVVTEVVPQAQWHKITVRFPYYGEKKLILEKAGLEVISS